MAKLEKGSREDRRCLAGSPRRSAVYGAANKRAALRAYSKTAWWEADTYRFIDTSPVQTNGNPADRSRWTRGEPGRIVQLESTSTRTPLRLTPGTKCGMRRRTDMARARARRSARGSESTRAARLLGQVRASALMFDGRWTEFRPRRRWPRRARAWLVELYTRDGWRLLGIGFGRQGLKFVLARRRRPIRPEPIKPAKRKVKR